VNPERYTLTPNSPLLRPNKALTKKKFFPVRFLWASSQKGLRKKKKGEMRSEKNRTPQDLGEALVTKYPYEAVGDFFFGRGLIRTQERTA